MTDEPVSVPYNTNDSDWTRRLKKMSEAGTPDEQHTQLLALVAREVRNVRLILVWVLILVPIIMLILGIIADVAINKVANPPSTSTSIDGGF